MTAPGGKDTATVADAELVIPAIAADGSLYRVGKLDAHRRGLPHLAISVFVFAGDRLLIQRRARGKYHSGGLWANSCCSHPHWGESPAACAARRLSEELGVVLPLKAGGVVDYRAEVGGGLVENERVHIFRGDLPAPREVSGFDRAEVEAVAWVGQQELRDRVARDPGSYTPWLRIYLDRWDELALRPAA